MNFAMYMLMLLSSILEAFPISSSTHISFLKKMLLNNEYDFYLMTNLEYIMHGIILLAIVFYFFNRWFFIIKKLNKAPFIILKIMVLGFITNVATLIGFILFYFYGLTISLSFGYAVTSISLISLFFLPKNEKSQYWNWKNALLIGAAQGCALLPGISRFAATFSVARWCGIPQKRSFEISFLIELPILAAACIKGIYGFSASSLFSLNLLFMVTIFIALIGTIIGFLVIETIMMNGYFSYFSLYTLALMLLTWLY